VHIYTDAGSTVNLKQFANMRYNKSACHIGCHTADCRSWWFL